MSMEYSTWSSLSSAVMSPRPSRFCGLWESLWATFLSVMILPPIHSLPWMTLMSTLRLSRSSTSVYSPTSNPSRVSLSLLSFTSESLLQKTCWLESDFWKMTSELRWSWQGRGREQESPWRRVTLQAQEQRLPPQETLSPKLLSGQLRTEVKELCVACTVSFTTCASRPSPTSPASSATSSLVKQKLTPNCSQERMTPAQGMGSPFLPLTLRRQSPSYERSRYRSIRFSVPSSRSIATLPECAILVISLLMSSTSPVTAIWRALRYALTGYSITQSSLSLKATFSMSCVDVMFWLLTAVRVMASFWRRAREAGLALRVREGWRMMRALLPTMKDSVWQRQSQVKAYCSLLMATLSCSACPLETAMICSLPCGPQGMKYLSLTSTLLLSRQITSSGMRCPSPSKKVSSWPMAVGLFSRMILPLRMMALLLMPSPSSSTMNSPSLPSSSGNSTVNLTSSKASAVSLVCISCWLSGTRNLRLMFQSMLAPLWRSCFSRSMVQTFFVSFLTFLTRTSSFTASLRPKFFLLEGRKVISRCSFSSVSSPAEKISCRPVNSFCLPCERRTLACSFTRYLRLMKGASLSRVAGLSALKRLTMVALMRVDWSMPADSRNSSVGQLRLRYLLRPNSSLLAFLKVESRFSQLKDLRLPRYSRKRSRLESTLASSISRTSSVSFSIRFSQKSLPDSLSSASAAKQSSFFWARCWKERAAIGWNCSNLCWYLRRKSWRWYWQLSKSLGLSSRSASSCSNPSIENSSAGNSSSSEVCLSRIACSSIRLKNCATALASSDRSTSCLLIRNWIDDSSFSSCSTDRGRFLRPQLESWLKLAGFSFSARATTYSTVASVSNFTAAFFSASWPATAEGPTLVTSAGLGQSKQSPVQSSLILAMRVCLCSSLVAVSSSLKALELKRVCLSLGLRLKEAMSSRSLSVRGLRRKSKSLRSWGRARSFWRKASGLLESRQRSRSGWWFWMKVERSMQRILDIYQVLEEEFMYIRADVALSFCHQFNRAIAEINRLQL